MAFALNTRPLMKSTIMQHIHSLREQLIHTGVCEGLNHEKTIQLSQKLDEYIFLYQSISNKTQIVFLDKYPHINFSSLSKTYSYYVKQGSCNSCFFYKLFNYNDGI